MEDFENNSNFKKEKEELEEDLEFQSTEENKFLPQTSTLISINNQVKTIKEFNFTKHHITENQKEEEEDDEENEQITIKIFESMQDTYGLYVWTSSIVLAHFIWSNPHLFQRKTLLELGAGTSLPGLVAAAIGSKVTLTDCEDTELVLENCRETCILNQALFDGVSKFCPSVQGLTWGLVTSSFWNTFPQIDILIGADVFYEEKDFEDLIFTVSYFFDLNPDAVFYVGYQERSDNHRFMIALLLEQWKFQLEEILIDSFFPEDQLSLLQGKSFLIFKIKRKS